ncbi:methyltransferase [Streptomyces montanisoli]|uniref:Ribosomal RNA large subunit methyltransferase G n=1 Tax=Streptomyces montanisoli TaxID=2798581 RepID=A0A940MIS1_9ACTN|nr:methyltransferase [Streptomyces montanisoli]MBP0459303.1 methyltransferase [Streptomyces montanisoli]
MNGFTTPWGEHVLTRYPEDARDPLRAWDGADTYLLSHLADTAADLTGTVVVAGDRWGALTTALAAARLEQLPAGPLAPRGPLVQITDSHLTQCATRANLRRSGADSETVSLLSARDTPPARVDVLLVRVPKSLALLEDQLHRLAPALHPGSLVVGAGRTTEIHNSTLRLFEDVVGETRTTLAAHKSRLVLTTPAADKVGDGPARPPNPWPVRYALPRDVGVMSGRTAVGHAGIFCAERLDIGTRFFLRHLPERHGPEHVVDLGCGNGVVGTAAALANPEARVTFVDESHSAIASARATFQEAFQEAFAPGLGGAAKAPSAHFVLGDALRETAAGSVDLVLNNPPFHSHQATTDKTAWRMFTGARAALRPGGELWVVGNRHLGYHAKLRRLFGRCEVVASDPKFVVLRAIKG